MWLLAHYRVQNTSGTTTCHGRVVPPQSLVLFGYLCLFSNDLNVYYGNYAQDNKKIYAYSINPFRIQKGGGGGGTFPRDTARIFNLL